MLIRPHTSKKKMDHNRGNSGSQHQALSAIEERAINVSMRDQDTLAGLPSGIDSGLCNYELLTASEHLDCQSQFNISYREPFTKNVVNQSIF